MTSRALALVVALTAVLAWLTSLDAEQRPRVALPAARAQHAAGAARAQAMSATRTLGQPAALAAVAIQPPADAPAFAGPGPDDPAGPGMLPHPITAEHARIYRDVELLDGAWQALKRRDFERARSLLREHAAEYPGGYDDLDEGLSIVADCMQHPSASARERAQRFYDTHTASSARRRIRTQCLQAP